MAYDEGLAQLLRDDLAGEPISEVRMFGGIAFMLAGHMVCGVHRGGVMVRVGKLGQAAALALPGVRPMLINARTMAAMVHLDASIAEDDALRGQVLGMALACVRALPPKVAKPAKG